MAYEEARRYLMVYASLRDLRDSAHFEIRGLKDARAMIPDDGTMASAGDYDNIQKRIKTRKGQLRAEYYGKVKEVPEELKSREPFRLLTSSFEKVLSQ